MTVVTAETFWLTPALWRVMTSVRPSCSLALPTLSGRPAGLDPEATTAAGRHRHVAVRIQDSCGETGPFRPIHHLPPMVQAPPVERRRPAVPVIAARRAGWPGCGRAPR